MTPNVQSVLKAIKILSKRLDRPPLQREVAEYLDMSAQTVCNCVEQIRTRGLLRNGRKCARGLVLKDRCPECGQEITPCGNR